MPRQPQIEYAGAVYHVMSRGNHRQKVFRTDRDNAAFLEALGEACRRTGWKVHAYVLMGNHYHLLLETPEPNLVAGMQWLQSTYTQRFNAAHRECGHLFQGRYKAVPVDLAGGYFLAVATYIHLNPVRMRGNDFKKRPLQDYRWSSYAAYVDVHSRPDWLSVGRVLGDLGLADTAAGRRKFRGYMDGRVAEVRRGDKAGTTDEVWQDIRRGWVLGGDGFRREMLDRMGVVLQRGRRDSFSGIEVRSHDECRAEALIVAGMDRLGLSENDLKSLAMNHPAKYALAWLARRNTAVRNGWIKSRLRMGQATNFSEFLKKIESAGHGEWGFGLLAQIQNIKSQD